MKIELITQRIETAAVDIAPNDADCRDLGFALADALDESGRNYYHRLSRFYPSYSQSETDKQFDNCLKAHGHGVTIKTLFHLAKHAGIEILISKIAKYPNCQKWKYRKFQKRSHCKKLTRSKFVTHIGQRTGITSSAIPRSSPPEFNRQTYLAVAQKLGIPPKTAENHIKRLSSQNLIIHYAHDKYKKP